MIGQEIIAAAERIARRAAPSVGELATPLEGLCIFRATRPTGIEGALYKSVACLLLQGVKETRFAERKLAFAPGDFALFSHDLPVTSRIAKASPHTPYLSLALSIDFPLVRSLADEIKAHEPDGAAAESLATARASEALVDAFHRYLNAAETPCERDVLAPMIKREIHFRLLTHPQGAMLRRMMRRDAHESRIARAIARIRGGYSTALSVSELADEAGMSLSSFHSHFKALTSFTPLQYQKELRLLEARRLLTEEDRSVAAAAFNVGYESPTQFSREYARKYGEPPSESARQARAPA